MDDYTLASYKASMAITKHFSTSFGLSILLYPKQTRAHIYAIYGLVRVADEIVDSYRGDDASEHLNALEQETYRALESGYSANPTVHAFAQTAREYAIGQELIEPFFISMRLDLSPQTYTQELYETYIYGSAEVIGLMCLRVLVDDASYQARKAGAQRLGAAYQKVNFLRDIAADAAIGRWYFPDSQFDAFDENTKRAILKDIEDDFVAALPDLNALPNSAAKPIRLSYRYYRSLVKKIARTPASQLKTTRIRTSDAQKLAHFAWVGMGGK